MFYGLGTKERTEAFHAALDTMRGLFHKVFAMDNMILMNRTLGFRRDRKFMEAIKRHSSGRDDASQQFRVHTLVWAGQQALKTTGDFVECGVFKGYSSAVVADYLDFANVPRRWYLYDTFAGIPPQYDSEKHDHLDYHIEGLYESVVARFARYPNVRVVRGPVPDTFAEALPEKIAYLHIDLNSSAAETATFEKLFDRISPGGVIVSDDYGWSESYLPQYHATNVFMRQRGHPVLELATGQGLIIKGS